MTITEANEPLASRLKVIIAQEGLRQGYVATKAGFTPQQFSDMLNGRKIMKAVDIARIIDALGVTANDLFGMNDKSRE